MDPHCCKLVDYGSCAWYFIWKRSFCRLNKVKDLQIRSCWKAKRQVVPRRSAGLYRFVDGQAFFRGSEWVKDQPARESCECHSVCQPCCRIWVVLLIWSLIFQGNQVNNIVGFQDKFFSFLGYTTHRAYLYKLLNCLTNALWVDSCAWGNLPR